MRDTLLHTLQEILSILRINSNIKPVSNDMLKISTSEIRTPIGNMLTLLSQHRSILTDQEVDISLLRKLVSRLLNNSLIRLNHIGFCYKVESQEAEKQKLSELTVKSKFHLYQEESNDYGLWLFLGNTSDWHDPMIELLPVEKTSDKWVDYWLPHIQIDLDTRLTSNELENVIKLAYEDRIKPFPIVINGTTYILRSRLGITSGVNIFLDLTTNARKVQYHRQNILKLIV